METDENRQNFPHPRKDGILPVSLRNFADFHISDSPYYDDK